ncbi:hypothetical protein [Actinoplanes aureus]|uniref:Uncharacterized protein n=1 Tax=Actinoplanes aureus TaxID=2792083 RepID=A0A931CK49_9ACTN|nr:hypothetical protein [Actinoplanes aureus]MBG0568823.1 hypothetical protein [Actinoplanes aureus]
MGRIEPRPSGRAVGVLLIALIVIVGNLLLSGPASASTSRYHGKWMSRVAGCETNYRIGKTARLTTTTSADYGWVEWRASRTGKCAGYQWIRLHLARDVGFIAKEPDTKWWYLTYKRDPWGGIKTAYRYNKIAGGYRYLRKGTYSSRIFYAPSAKVCALFVTYYSPHPNRFLKIRGQGSYSNLTYCA